MMIGCDSFYLFIFYFQMRAIWICLLIFALVSVSDAWRRRRARRFFRRRFVRAVIKTAVVQAIKSIQGRDLGVFIYRFLSNFLLFQF